MEVINEHFKEVQTTAQVCGQFIVASNRESKLTIEHAKKAAVIADFRLCQDFFFLFITGFCNSLQTGAPMMKLTTGM